MNTVEREPWHLDKKVPLALILSMAIQTVLIVWWAASLSSRVEHQERQIVALTTSDAQAKQEARRIGEWLSRVDERIAAQTEMLRRVEVSVTARTQQQGNR
jgi:hypothetical protein